MCVGGGGKREVPGQLRLCPTSADRIFPIHPCHVDGVACMCDCLTFLCNENSTCGTSDMVDVSYPCRSSWSEGPLRLHIQTHTYTKPLEKRNDKCFTSRFPLGRYSDRPNCLSQHFQTALKQWQLFHGTCLPQPLKATRKLIPTCFKLLCLGCVMKTFLTKPSFILRGITFKDSSNLCFVRIINQTRLQKQFQRGQNAFVDIPSLMGNQCGGKGVTSVRDAFHRAANRPKQITNKCIPPLKKKACH